MSLIKCHECGKEISDKAAACPNCGCPLSEFEKDSEKNPKEMPESEKPELFKCVECGRPLPVGIDKCIYCDHVYKKYNTTSVFGLVSSKCPKCGSGRVKRTDKIPLFKKARDFVGFGGILPTTKQEYDDEVKYVCKTCGYEWKDYN